MLRSFPMHRMITGTIRMQLQAPVVDHCGSPAYNNDCDNDFTPVTDLPYCSQVVRTLYYFRKLQGFMCVFSHPIACIFRATNRNFLLMNGTMHCWLAVLLFEIVTHLDENHVRTLMMHICAWITYSNRWQYQTYPCTYRDGPGMSGAHITELHPEICKTGVPLTLIFGLLIYQVLCRTAPSMLPLAFLRTWP